MARGKLRVYLGAAPGVGKTVDMLSEARRRRERGTDVVIGKCTLPIPSIFHGLCRGPLSKAAPWRE